MSNIPTTKQRGFWHNVRKYLREYTEVTGIHGLRYVTEKRSRTEKVVWALLLILSLGGCIYMISEIMYKYENTPVVVSFATEDTPLYQIPFPAITICPEAKHNKQVFGYRDIYRQIQKQEKVDETNFTKFSHLHLLCQDIDIIATIANKTVGPDFFETLDEIKIDPGEMFIDCSYNDEDIECEDFFTPIIIDEGICYSFNILGREEVFKDHVYNYAQYYHVPNKSADYFNIETGYKENANMNTYPRRAMMSGADNALLIFFNIDTDYIDPICNGIFKGFRVLIHNPWDVPRLTKHFFRVPFSKVVVAAMEPEIIVTSDTVRKFKPEKRKCFMHDERPLQYFKFYSQPNCLLECQTNYTLKKCGCVQYFMPRNNKTAICGNGLSKCVEQAESELKEKELESRLGGKRFCDCRPACTNMKFSVETSHSDFYFKEYFETHTQKMNEKNGTYWSVLQIYFKEEQFKTMERNELYGISDLISNFGGLLGLFTGFSLISLVEIIYFCSLRIFCNERMYGIWSGP
ncbi:hypothetical protein Zmor_024797 [Zophobas morio]|uniref:Sodium channel protein Nach n=1 Tax=Zophobas morio TaxID=2755281 RepID=A0AA38M8V4_9CUCU|nr:hypothetical protein Zmor_024797 [Zophobas morio]